MKPYRIKMTEDAEQDIVDIYNYIAENDSPDKASPVLEKLEEKILTLSTLPHRGNVPKELDYIGVTEYREIHFKPYRIIYRVVNSEIIVLCCVDGRRDMISFLERRLLR